MLLVLYWIMSMSCYKKVVYMSYLKWFIEKCNINENIVLFYNIKRIELGVYDNIDNKILKKFVVNTKELNKLLDDIKNIKLVLIQNWNEIEY